MYLLRSEKDPDDLINTLLAMVAVGLIRSPDTVETITAAEFGNDALVEVLTMNSDGDELLWSFQLTRTDGTSDWLVSALYLN